MTKNKGLMIHIKNHKTKFIIAAVLIICLLVAIPIIVIKNNQANTLLATTFTAKDKAVIKSAIMQDANKLYIGTSTETYEGFKGQYFPDKTGANFMVNILYYGASGMIFNKHTNQLIITYAFDKQNSGSFDMWCQQEARNYVQDIFSKDSEAASAFEAFGYKCKKLIGNKGKPFQLTLLFEDKTGNPFTIWTCYL